MAELLKNIYNEAFFQHFLPMLKSIYPTLETKKFHKEIISNGWDDLELKQRMRRISETLHRHLPKEYSEAISILKQLIEKLLHEETGNYGFQYMFVPDYIEVYGINELETSIQAMEIVTRYSSCEFAIRPFLIQYPTEMLTQCKKWSSHSDPMVRRLSSEGTRPRLPWGMAVPWIKKNPEVVLPILEKLKADPNEIVRRSVANSINDIAKDKPDLVLEIVEKWKGYSEETDKLLKHASRTLLKKSNSKALEFFGIKKIKSAQVVNFALNKKNIRIGETLEFSFDLELKSAAKIRIEYAIDFRKANNSLSRKVFKLSELDLEKGNHFYQRKQSFKDFTTRKHYPGKHSICIIVNGEVKSSLEFNLKIL